MIIPKDVKVISLDFWETLGKSNKDFQLPRTQLLARYFQYKGDLDDLHKVIKSTNKEIDTLSDIDCVQRGFVFRVNAIYQRIMNDEHATLSVEALRALEEELSVLVAMYPPLLIEEDLTQTIRELRARGYKIALISNTGFIDGRHMLVAFEKVGIRDLLDYIIFSNEIDICKPHKRIFAELISQAHVQPYEVLHIGDNWIADVEGSTAAEMQAALLLNDKNRDKVTEEMLTIPSIRYLLKSY
jgi:putative hydrolase of the HAD superfamily